MAHVLPPRRLVAHDDEVRGATTSARADPSRRGADHAPPPDEPAPKAALLDRRISELGLSIEGSPVERLVERLYDELDAHGLGFKPPVYLSDEWGCPEATPLIGVPFYLADPELSRVEAEAAAGVEDEAEAMRYMRHEAGHAYNYAYRLYDREDWRRIFGPYSRPYHDRYHVDPFSREYVRHVLGWYAQKHPDEDFAETFAVWLTPGLDWRAEYDGWPALRKLEYVDTLMREIARDEPPVAPKPEPEHLPVSAMRLTVAEHYRSLAAHIPIEDEKLFDGDLRTIFGTPASGVGRPATESADARAVFEDAGPDAGRRTPDAGATPGGQQGAGDFIRRHARELVNRIGYWTGEGPALVRAFVEHLAKRADALGLVVVGLEASTLIELTAFGTAVMMNYRYTDQLGHRREPS